MKGGLCIAHKMIDFVIDRVHDFFVKCQSSGKQSYYYYYFSLFIFSGHSTREPASNRVNYFILRTFTGTDASHSQHMKKLGEVLEKTQVTGPEG